MTRRTALLAAVTVAVAALAVPSTGAVAAPGGPPAAEAAAVTGANSVLSGTVTTADGEPFTDGYVLAVTEANASFVRGSSPATLFAAAEANESGVYAAPIRDDGSYSLSLPENGTYSVVATDGTNVSAVAGVTVDGATALDLTVEPVTAADVSLAAGSAGETTPGDTVPMVVRVPNPAEHVVGPVTVTVGDLPEGWTVASNQSADGEWVGAESTWRWSLLPTDQRAAGTLTVAIPEDAATGEYEVPVTVTVGDVVVREGTWTVSVEEPSTATPGTTAPGTTTPAGTTANGTPATAAPNGTTAADGDGSVPGLGALAALAALALLWLGGRRR